MGYFKILESPLETTIAKAGTYHLLFNNMNVQVYHNTITKGRSMLFSPFESNDAENVLFILKGRLYHVNEDKIITDQMHLQTKNLVSTHNLIALEDTEYIQVREKRIMEKQLVLLEKASKMIEAIQKKDKYTESHCDQTGNLAVATATLMGLDSQNIQYLLYASKLHDIGKIEIPIEILNKPERLTKEEFEIVQTHCKIGHDIILNMLKEDDHNLDLKQQNLFRNVADIIHQHHEKYDGSGYPNQLTHDKIRIEAKIIFVADSYSAMTTDRPYQKAKSSEVAIEELKSYIGIWYDKEVVEVFELFLKRFQKYQNI